MKAFLAFFLSIVGLSSKGQPFDTWKVCFNNQIVLKANSNQNEAVVTIKPALVLNNTDGILKIDYTPANLQKSWKRTFYVTDKEEQNTHTAELKTDKGSVIFKSALLKNWAASKTAVYIYTTSIPLDEQKAALIRVRRILLFKIEWK